MYKRQEPVEREYPPVASVCRSRTKSCSNSGCSYSYTENDTHSYSYGSWSTVGTKNVCRKRTETCSRCGRTGSTEKEGHASFNNKGVCKTCGYKK